MTTVHRGREYSGRFGLLAALTTSSLIAVSAHAQTPPPPAAPAHHTKVVRTGVSTPGVVRSMIDIVPKAVYTVEGSPDWSVVTDNAIWVSSSRVNHVVQLLPTPAGQPASQTGKVGIIATVEKPCSGLAHGWGSIWAPSCGTHILARLDEKTGTVTARIAADPANSEGGITIGDGSVWMVAKPSLLVRIDPATNAIISRLELPSGSENPAYGEGFVWISSFAHNQLLKVDPKLNKIVSTIDIGPQPRFITIGAGSVWTLNQGDGSVSRVDMKTGKLLATIPCGVPGEGGEMTFGAESVWATMFDFPITQIDPKTNQPVKQWKGKGGDGLRFGLGSLWLSNGALGTVWQLSPDQK